MHVCVHCSRRRANGSRNALCIPALPAVHSRDVHRAPASGTMCLTSFALRSVISATAAATRCRGTASRMVSWLVGAKKQRLTALPSAGPAVQGQVREEGGGARGQALRCAAVLSLLSLLAQVAARLWGSSPTCIQTCASAAQQLTAAPDTPLRWPKSVDAGPCSGPCAANSVSTAPLTASYVLA
jgi:hypothetical protein